jgi:hypothetical protein
VTLSDEGERGPETALAIVSGVAIDTDSRSRVHKRIHDLVREYVGNAELPANLVDAPVAVQCGTAVVCLRLVDGDPAVLRVFSPMLRGIGCTPELLGELNELNARLNFLRFFWRGDTVYAAAEMLAETLTAAELGNACDWVSDAADYYDVRLRARFGGEVAFADAADGSPAG